MLNFWGVKELSLPLVAGRSFLDSLTTNNFFNLRKLSLLEFIVKRLKSLAKTIALSSAYLCNFRPKPSDVHPKPSDVHQKPSDAHQKASDGKLIALETVATTPKIVSAEEYSRKPFTLHFLNLSIYVAEG